MKRDWQTGTGTIIAITALMVGAVFLQTPIALGYLKMNNAISLFPTKNMERRTVVIAAAEMRMVLFALKIQVIYYGW